MHWPDRSAGEYPGWACPTCGAWDSGSVMPRRAQWCDGACSHPKVAMERVSFVRVDVYRQVADIVRVLVEANDTRDGAIGEIRSVLGDDAADRLRTILCGAGEGAGSERDSSRAMNCRRPSARRYDLDAVVAAHRASRAGGTWVRLSDAEYDAIAGTILRGAKGTE